MKISVNQKQYEFSESVITGALIKSKLPKIDGKYSLFQWNEEKQIDILVNDEEEITASIRPIFFAYPECMN